MSSDDSKPRDQLTLVRHHLRFGWWSLLAFICLGALLESMHGFKVGWYLDVHNETRRLMWRLAHAHGALLSVLHIAFALTARALPDMGAASRRFASWSLMAASVLLPGGFFLAGLKVYGGDPGPAILLVPLGAVCLIVAVVLTALAASRAELGSR